MASVLNATTLLAANADNEAWLPWAILAFLIIVVVVLIFFVFLMLMYLMRGIESLLGPKAKSKAGQALFSPAVGIPLFIVLVLTIGLIVFFTNQAEILAFFNTVFGE